MITENERREITEAQRERDQAEHTNDKKTELMVLGCDLGQQSDYTAIIALEKIRFTMFKEWIEDQTSRVELNNPLSTQRPVYDTSIQYNVRYIERVRLGTSYTAIVDHLLALNEALGEYKPVFALDASGVGRAVLDMMKERGITRVTPITTTSGYEAEKKKGEWFVPKAILSSNLKAMFGRGIIKIGKDVDGADHLLKELDNFMIKKTNAGNLKFEAADESGLHDDLVSSLAFAAFIATKHKAIPIVAGEGVGQRHRSTPEPYVKLKKEQRERWF